MFEDMPDRIWPVQRPEIERLVIDDDLFAVVRRCADRGGEE